MGGQPIAGRSTAACQETVGSHSLCSGATMSSASGGFPGRNRRRQLVELACCAGTAAAARRALPVAVEALLRYRVEEREELVELCA